MGRRGGAVGGGWSYLASLATQPRALGIPPGAMPALVGLCAASLVTHRWSWPIAAICLVSAVSTCLAALVVNDIADEHGDSRNTDFVPGFSGGGRGLQGGTVSRHDAWLLAFGLGTVSLVSGSLLAYLTTGWILVLGGIAAAGGIAYSIGPRLVRKGWGDIVLGFCAGVLPALCGWLSISHQIDVTAIAVSFACGLTMSTVCFALHTLDVESDRRDGKSTLACRVTDRWHGALLMGTGTLAVLVGGLALVRVGLVTIPSVGAALILVAGAPLWLRRRGLGRAALGIGTPTALLAVLSVTVAAMLARVPGAIPASRAVIVLTAAALARWLVPVVHKAQAPAVPQAARGSVRQ